MEHEAQESWVSLGQVLGGVLIELGNKTADSRRLTYCRPTGAWAVPGLELVAGWGELPGNTTADGSRPAARFDALRRIRPCDYACPPAGFRSPQAVLN